MLKVQPAARATNARLETPETYQPFLARTVVSVLWKCGFPGQFSLSLPRADGTVSRMQENVKCNKVSRPTRCTSCRIRGRPRSVTPRCAARFTDEEIADLALYLGAENASVENVAANRARLARWRRRQ
jgi:hypothetical protein